MRKLSGSMSALLLGGALIFGCNGSSSTNLAAVEQALQGCSQASMTRMLQVLYGLVGIPDVIAGDPAFPGFLVNATQSIDPLDPANTWDFSVVFDTNGNGIPDTAVVGKVTFSEDPTDGLSPLATLQFNFTVQNTPPPAGLVFEAGTLTGTGNLLATVGTVTEQVTISGTVSLTDTAGDGCTANIVFPVATPLNILFTDFTPPVQLAANAGVFELFGTIQTAIESLGHTLDATLTILQGDQTVSGTGSVDDTTDFDFSFELLPSDAEIAELFDCGLTGGDMLDLLSQLYMDLIDSGVLTGGPPPTGVTITPTGNPNVFNYTLDLVALDAADFGTGTLSGQATLTFPMIAGVVVLPTEVAFTWTFSGATLTTDPATTVTGNSTRALILHLDGTGSVVSFSGAGTLHLNRVAPLAGITQPDLDCTVTIDIPDNDPITQAGDTGSAIITATAGENVMIFVLDVFEQTIAVTINGIPYPFLFF